MTSRRDGPLDRARTLFYAPPNAMPRRPLSMILALGRNGALGRDGKLPWSHPEDRAALRAHHARARRHHGPAHLGGRGPSPSRPRQRRRLAFLRTDRSTTPTVLVARSLDEALTLAWEVDDTPFVIGGARLFAEAMPFITRIYLTEIPEAPDADVFFELDRTDFTVVDERTGEGGLRYLVLERNGRRAD